MNNHDDKPATPMANWSSVNLKLKEQATALADLQSLVHDLAGDQRPQQPEIGADFARDAIIAVLSYFHPVSKPKSAALVDALASIETSFLDLQRNNDEPMAENALNACAMWLTDAVNKELKDKKSDG